MTIFLCFILIFKPLFAIKYKRYKCVMQSFFMVSFNYQTKLIQNIIIIFLFYNSDPWMLLLFVIWKLIEKYFVFFIIQTQIFEEQVMAAAIEDLEQCCICEQNKRGKRKCLTMNFFVQMKPEVHINDNTRFFLKFII